MVQCLSCAEGSGRILSIKNVQYTPDVEIGKQFSISISVESSEWFGNEYLRLCLFEGDINLAHSKSLTIRSGETIDYKFTGTMPNRDMHLKISLQMEALGFMEHCQDSRYIIISKFTPGQPPAVQIPTIDTDAPPVKGVDDTVKIVDDDDDNDNDEKTLWGWLFGVKDDAEDGIEVLDWIMDNLVLVLILVLIILLVIRFG